jgi:hypothetical protein
MLLLESVEKNTLILFDQLSKVDVNQVPNSAPAVKIT